MGRERKMKKRRDEQRVGSRDSDGQMTNKKEQGTRDVWMMRKR